MELFKKLNEMLGEGTTLTITVAKKGETMTVGVLPGNDLVKDAAKSRIVPLNLSGTAEDLDAGFIEAIESPIARTSGLLIDMAAYEKAQEEAKAKSKMEADKKAAEEKRRKEVADWMDLAKINVKENKFRDALTCVANARKITLENEVDELNKLESDITSASGVDSMFGALEDKSDGKNIKLGGKAVKGKSGKKSNEEEEEDE